ncbi:MAG: methionine ABC transporter ATP-binding protein [Burkholderiales bacterium]|nr:methionine ABC transporter ATP-binding protein [Burkholderiales bacterium]
MIDLQHISQEYKTADGKSTFFACKDVNIHVNAGEIFGIIGRSGAGKSTLVRCINLLNRPTHGTVIVDGKDLTAMRNADLRMMRREIGMIFQHFNLLSSRTVYDNVALPLELAGASKEEIKKKVEPLLDLVGLTEHRNKYPAQLSGGQKQRVGIARALSSDPKILLSDEATSALDPETTQATLELLKKINRELGVTIVMITHEMEVVKQICQRIAVMDKGQIIEEGNVIDVFRDPKNAVTQAMLGTAVRARSIPESMRESVRKVIQEPDSKGHHGHLIRLTFVGSSATEPVLSATCHKYNMDFNILLGQVDEVQGESYGTLTIIMRGDKENMTQALDFIRSNGVKVEELNDVV